MKWKFKIRFSQLYVLLVVASAAIFAPAVCFGDPGLETFKQKWKMRVDGNAIHGPGSYYLGDATVTQRFTSITTEADAWKKVYELAKSQKSNPPLIWQLTDPWDRVPGHLVIHFAKFMSKNLDGHAAAGHFEDFCTRNQYSNTGKSVDCYTQHLEGFAKSGHPHPRV